MLQEQAGHFNIQALLHEESAFALMSCWNKEDHPFTNNAFISRKAAYAALKISFSNNVAFPVSMSCAHNRWPTSVMLTFELWCAVKKIWRFDLSERRSVFQIISVHFESYQAKTGLVHKLKSLSDFFWFFFLFFLGMLQPRELGLFLKLCCLKT